MVDLAVGVMIGAAFGKITTSLVNDILMPPIGLAMGEMDFDEFTWVLREARDNVPAVTINYGSFIEVLINFLIIAWVLFFFIKAINNLRDKQENAPDSEKPVPPPEDIRLLREIRDALNAKDTQ